MAFSEDACIHRPKQGPTSAHTGPQSSIVGALDAMLQARMGQGFTRERNLKGWRMEGLIPFNRNALWKKRGDLLRASTGFSKVSSATPSNQENPAVDPPATTPPTDAPPASAPPLFAPSAGVAPDPSPED